MDLLFQSAMLMFVFGFGYMAKSENGLDVIFEKANTEPIVAAGFLLGIYMALAFIFLAFNAIRMPLGDVFDSQQLLRDLDKHWEKFTPAEQRAIGNILEEQERQDNARKGTP